MVGREGERESHSASIKIMKVKEILKTEKVFQAKGD
jgi:hypothetical protein